MDKKTVAKQGVDDLVLLPKVTEEMIVENLKKRHAADLIYTNVGPVLISVNPFKKLGIFGNDQVELYKGRFRHELPPHIFALAEEAYRTMRNEGENNCVIISGESGAGKTEASKLIMQYISCVSGNSANVEYVKHVILESNPLLEAFGNAKTLRNNNSSRFGKYFEIQFNAVGDPCGGRITNYLLEKSRVVFQTSGERTFHIFYQLLSGASQAEINELQLYSPDNYYYLNQSQCYTVDGTDDKADFQDVRKAMNTAGITAYEQGEVLRLVAGILHLGNISFVEDDKGNAAFYDAAALDLACSLLRVEPANLKSALLFRVIQTAGGRRSTYNSPLNVEQASGSRDALAKSIYDRMFDWLVSKVNEALQKNKAPFKTVIGILDIFGFEIFQKNGFEQFCINFVNEKLQQFFIELTLKAEQEEYVREGIKWEPIKYFNNQVVVDLIEGKKPPGIFLLIDDVCATMHAQSTGVDLKFLEKMSASYNGHLHFRAFDTAFAVKHYAGEVTYEVEGFCDKNKDTLWNDLIEAVQCSSSDFLVSLFPEQTKQDATKKRPTTAGFKIKNSAGLLMETLAACTPHYVRCIKPNETKQPRDFTTQRVQHQVQYLGLLENVRVRRAGFAYRAPFDRFLRRYKRLSRKTWGMWGEWTGDAKEGSKVILTDLNLDPQQWQLGVSKVFIRHPETLFGLEEMLQRRDEECVQKIAKAWKTWKQRRHAIEQRIIAADLLKGKKERQRISVERKFTGDYSQYANNFALQDALKQYSKENVLFADQVVKLNRRAKPERRDFLITNEAFYVITRAVKKKQVVYQLTRRTPIKSISRISLSTLADNYLVIHVPTEYDNLLENEKKTEILTIFKEQYKLQTGQELSLSFADTIQYSIKEGGSREVSFAKLETAAIPVLKKTSKGVQVNIASGLPKDTDTTPKNIYRRQPGAAAAKPAQAARPAGAAAAQPQGAARSLPQPAAAGAARPMPQPAAAAAARPMPQPGGAAAGGRALPQPAAAAQPAQRALPQPAAAKAPPPKPAAAAPRPRAKALYAYNGQTSEELTFKEADVMFVLQKDPGGWWECELRGAKGWAPANYLQEI